MCVTWGLYFMGSVASVRELVPCVWSGVSTSWGQWPVSGSWCHVCGLGSLLHGVSGQCQGVGAMCVVWGLYFMGSVASVRGLVLCVVFTRWVQCMIDPLYLPAFHQHSSATVATFSSETNQFPWTPYLPTFSHVEVAAASHHSSSDTFFLHQHPSSAGNPHIGTGVLLGSDT